MLRFSLIVQMDIQDNRKLTYKFDAFEKLICQFKKIEKMDSLTKTKKGNTFLF
jgi:hypothetical protein